MTPVITPRRPALAWLCLFILAAGPAAAESRTETRRYVETAGDRRVPVTWRLEKGDVFRLFYLTPDAEHVTVNTPAQETISWRMTDEAEDARLEVRRKGDRMLVTGSLEGEAVEKTIEIDALPWYQATSISLRPFALSAAETVEFWTFRAASLKMHKLRAVKREVETIEVNQKTWEAQRIQLQLTGLLSAFWKSDYWFRKADGVFLKFKGPGGPPGHPDIIVEYAGGK